MKDLERYETEDRYARELAELDRLAHLMDRAIRIPVIGYRIGLDGLLGLIPGIGDAAALAPAGYILYKAKRLGVSDRVFLRMMLNTGVDTVLGTIPLIGDLFDFAYKSNSRNVRLLREHIQLQRTLDVRQRSATADVGGSVTDRDGTANRGGDRMPPPR